MWETKIEVIFVVSFGFDVNDIVMTLRYSIIPGIS